MEIQRLLGELILSYRDDFAKYRRRVPSSRIDAVFRSVARQGQGKFVYSHVDTDGNSDQIRAALETLILAGLVYPVTHTAANGIPLGAEANDKYRRMLLFDTGLIQRMLNLDIVKIIAPSDLQTANQGALAEVDYVVQVGTDIYPIEVKSGEKGSIQSMRLFMASKGIPKGIRTSLENFAVYDDILLYPLYAIKNVFKLG